MSDYREALELCDDPLFEVDKYGKRPLSPTRNSTLTRWDKLSIYLAVSETDPDPASIIFARIQHREISKGAMQRFLRTLVRAKAIHEIPNLGDMRRVTYLRKDVFG
ncbi:hypothetical protein LCGC14_1501910 [marine sediment metagenome]|uniref:Uncharacterized protein n=1 Tax=marine sediment metagenome TaxID=412755 RepID=A0A0F9J4C7_9ZZZZ